MALSKYTILVADYISTDMLLFKILLQQEHCHLLTASTGAKTLELAKKKHPDLILLDINMPDMSGFEIEEALKCEDEMRDIPILFVVDMGDYPIVLPNGKILSKEEYIEKPYDLRLLVKRILKRLGQ